MNNEISHQPTIRMVDQLKRQKISSRKKGKGGLSHFVATFVICVVFTGIKAQPYQFGDFWFDYSNKRVSEQCKTSETQILTFWVSSGKQMSFNIKGSNPAANMFTPADDTTKQISVLERGIDSCQMVDTINFPGWVFIGIVAQPHPSISGKCTVPFFISTSHLIACTGSSHTDIETYITFGSGNYDQVDQDSRVRFTNDDNALGGSSIRSIRIMSSFGLGDFSEQLMEMILLSPFNGNQRPYAGSFYIGYFNFMREAYYNRGGHVIPGKVFVERSTWDDLRGYYLIPDSDDPYGIFRDTFEYTSKEISAQNIYLQFYMSNPQAMTANEVYFVTLKTEPVILTDASYKLKRMEYKLKIQRVTSGTQVLRLTLERIIGGSSDQTIVLDTPYTGANNNWFHFGVTLGYGLLYSIDGTNGKLRRYETLSSWYDGNSYFNHMSYKENEVYESFTAGTFYPNKRRMVVSVQLEAFSDQAMTSPVLTNNFGLRVFQAGLHFGGFPPNTISAPTTGPDNRCFLKGLMDSECYFHAFLINENDSNDYGLSSNKYTARKSYCSTSECRYCHNADICMFTKTGINEDLYFSDTNSFIQERWTTTRFDASKPEHSTKFVKILNNKGKEYNVRCPLNCKLFSIY